MDVFRKMILSTHTLPETIHVLMIEEVQSHHLVITRLLKIQIQSELLFIDLPKQLPLPLETHTSGHTKVESSWIPQLVITNISITLSPPLDTDLKMELTTTSAKTHGVPDGEMVATSRCRPLLEMVLAESIQWSSLSRLKTLL